MDTGSGLSGLAYRQDPQACPDGQRSDFVSQTVLLQGCVPTDLNCLCTQQGANAFPIWFLKAVCNVCDGSSPQVDPITALEQICPDQSQSLATSFTCTNFPTQASSSTSSPLGSTSSAPSSSQISPTTSSSTSSTGLVTTTAVMIVPPARSSVKTSDSTPTSLPSSLPRTTEVSTSYLTEYIPTTTVPPATISPTDIAISSGASRHKNGLSTGAKAGIGVAAGVSFIMLVLALIFFCGRRRRKAGWAAKGVNPRELYPEDGVNSAYALNGGYTESPIGTAITTENKAHLGAGGIVPAVREIYMDEEDDRRNHPNQDDTRALHVPDSRNNSQTNFHEIPLPSRPAAARNSQIGSPIPRKEIATPSPPPSYPTPLPRTIYTPSPPHSRSNSRISGVLRGPVPDMYAFGGEAIVNDEELERLEEEERRIDEAIQESERLRQMRVERDAVRGRIEERRSRLDGL